MISLKRFIPLGIDDSLSRTILILHLHYAYIYGELLHKMKTLFLLVKYIRNPFKILRLLCGQNTTIKLRNKVIRGSLQDIWYWLYCEDKGFKVEVQENDIYFMKDKTKFVFPKEVLPIMWEDFEKYKVFDYRGKTVLDVGSFCGETAVLFHNWGAHKVIIFEPNPVYHSYIKENVELNNVDASIYMQAICDKENENNKVSFSRVLSQWKIDIAKLDCEGCEAYLLRIPCHLLRKIHN